METNAWREKWDLLYAPRFQGRWQNFFHAPREHDDRFKEKTVNAKSTTKRKDNHDQEQ